VRIIAKKTLEGFIHQHSNCASQLRTWYQIASKAEWASLDAVRQTFPSADAVGNKTVFNIKGNAYRLITAIHYNRQTIYIREFLTHAEYNKGDWKTR
jgi:mRNA interferase HigB